MKNLYKLINAICEVYDDKSLIPKDGNTWCNQAFFKIASRLGLSMDFNMTANMLYDYIQIATNWKKIKMEECQQFANDGYLVIAIKKENPHGHVCVIRPGMEYFSGGWNCKTPACMNIGRQLIPDDKDSYKFISKGVNYAFKEIPEFYICYI